ncbi:hypothetical protein E2C01_036955 [Portunus trituberculatus]|uniref:Uncharacterized protein n=1 Tax=Portunus trituberculatus TaxID=210409 RepID=A0A5B7F822_PORTR|nr:hypothetical protein [Portunus trituberculatus]
MESRWGGRDGVRQTGMMGRGAGKGRVPRPRQDTHKCIGRGWKKRRSTRLTYSAAGRGERKEGTPKSVTAASEQNVVREMRAGVDDGGV